MNKSRSLSTSLQHMTRVLRAEDVANLSDSELVHRFVTYRDEAAFAAIVRRYGIIVLAVCRRVLQHEHDAEDAFQATFLILAQKAGRIQRVEEIGNWLYGVAVNVARKAKTCRHRRELKEQEATRRKAMPGQPGLWNELQEILDHELYALADKYRTPIVLCDLRGLTIHEAAEAVGCPPKTLGTRLSRGRAILADRLSKRGLAISAGAMAAALASCGTSAALTPIQQQLLLTTVYNATCFLSGSTLAISPMVTALAQGVSKIMLMKSLKYAGMLSCCILISSGLVRHFTAQAAVSSSDQLAKSHGVNASNQKKSETKPPRTSHFDLFMRHLEHVLAWFGPSERELEISAAATADDKNEQEKQTLSGVWLRKDGDFEFKLDFSEKGTLKIALQHGDKGGTITSDCTLGKDGIVKGKVMQVEGGEHVKEKLPVGAEFKFKWKTKEKTATLEDIESEKAPIMKHLEGNFEQSK